MLTSLAFFAALTAGTALATPDFYGVKMKGEDFAQNIFMLENDQIPDFSNDRPGTDKRIYAYAYVSSTIGGGRGISIEVYNHSDKPIATEKLFRELEIVTWDDTRYDRSETEMMWNKDRLLPGENATFNFKFPGIRVPKEEVRLIVCSFDMGETMIFLFPLKKRVEAAPAPKTSRLFDILRWNKQKTQTPKSAEPETKNVKKTITKKVLKKVPKKKASEPAAADRPAEEKKAEQKPARLAEQCATPIKMVQSFFRNIGESWRRDGAPETPAGKTVEEPAARAAVAEEEETEMEEVWVDEVVEVEEDEKMPLGHLVEPSQVLDGVRYHFRPDFRKDVQQAQKQLDAVVYEDRPWTMGDPDRYNVRQEGLETPGLLPREAKVLVANLDYGFVVVNAGYRNGFGKNTILNVVRDGRRIAKVMITKPREKISGAVILPEWNTGEQVRPGDAVGVSS